MLPSRDIVDFTDDECICEREGFYKIIFELLRAVALVGLEHNKYFFIRIFFTRGLDRCHYFDWMMSVVRDDRNGTPPPCHFSHHRVNFGQGRPSLPFTRGGDSAPPYFTRRGVGGGIVSNQLKPAPCADKGL